MRALTGIALVVVMLMIVPATGGGRAIGPARAGDWEGTSGRATASFAVVRSSGHMTVTDVALWAGSRCVQGIVEMRRLGRIARDGSFGSTVFGGRVSASGGRMWLRANYPSNGRACRVNRSFAMHRASRVVVKDGHWSGSTSAGDPVSVVVSLGGRVADVTAGVTVTDCQGANPVHATSSRSGLFVPANGRLVGPNDYRFAFDGTSSASVSYMITGTCPRTVEGKISWGG